MSIGVLALQGDFDLHRKALDRLGIESVEVRLPRQLDQVGGLIMPGGESTTLLKLLDEWEFVPALEKFHAASKPIMGTCAGLILLARDVESPKQPSLGFIDITAVRNAYGRQKESFETEGEADLGEGPRPIKMVFIRAPRISRAGSAVPARAAQGRDGDGAPGHCSRRCLPPGADRRPHRPSLLRDDGPAGRRVAELLVLIVLFRD